MQDESALSDRQRRRMLRLAMLAATLPLANGRLLAQAAAAKPKIGIIGSGNVGSNLGRAWTRAGYVVMFSSLDLEADKKLAAATGPTARAGTPKEAAAFGDVLLFAVPYGALPALGRELGTALRNKMVIDACNPFPQRDGAIAEEARTQGAGLVSARLLPGARIVRAFNAVPAARMSEMHLTPGKVGMPIAGDDRATVELVSRLIRDIGFEPVHVGGLTMGKHLVPGTPLAGEHAPARLREIASGLR